MAGKVAVYSLSGKKTGEVSLPDVFSADYDPALIKRAVLAGISARIQPKGNYRESGRDNSAIYRGRRSLPQGQRSINVGNARLPRMKNRRMLVSGMVARVPEAVGGPKAHPPKPEQVRKEKINKKERRKAFASAIAATTIPELVGRKHKFETGLVLPVVIEDKFAELEKTNEVVKVLKTLKLYQDVESTRKKRKIRAGKGKRRGRKYKKRKSILIVTEKNSNVYRAARNLEGVEVSSVRNLSTELLAPGTEAGRLTLWSLSAVKALESR